MVTDAPPLMQEEKKEKQKILGETKLNQEKLRKEEMHKAEDVLDEIGQSNEKKGREATQKAYKAYQEENFRIKSDRIAWLNEKAKFTKDRKNDYFCHVDTIVRYELSFLELPIGYTCKSEVTDKGIKLVLYDRWNQIHMGGFIPCGMGLYDEQACRSSINKIDDLITYLEKHPPSGIFLS